MSLREDFEALISAPPIELKVARYPDDGTKFAWPGQYKDPKVQLAWEAVEWADKRAQKLNAAQQSPFLESFAQEALQACEQHTDLYKRSHAHGATGQMLLYEGTATDCLDELRKLAAKYGIDLEK